MLPGPGRRDPARLPPSPLLGPGELPLDPLRPLHEGVDEEGNQERSRVDDFRRIPKVLPPGRILPKTTRRLSLHDRTSVLGRLPGPAGRRATATPPGSDMLTPKRYWVEASDPEGPEPPRDLVRVRSVDPAGPPENVLWGSGTSRPDVPPSRRRAGGSANALNMESPMAPMLQASHPGGTGTGGSASGPAREPRPLQYRPVLMRIPAGSPSKMAALRHRFPYRLVVTPFPTSFWPKSLMALRGNGIPIIPQTLPPQDPTKGPDVEPDRLNSQGPQDPRDDGGEGSSCRNPVGPMPADKSADDPKGQTWHVNCAPIRGP